MTARDDAPGQGINPFVANPARRQNYLLGQKDNYEADRESGEEFKRIYPGIIADVLASRAFVGRAVRHLAAKRGVRQFLDIGTGLPAPDQLHEIAQEVEPSCRIVYVDHDDLVLTHARALLTSDPRGVTAHVDADLRNPAEIIKQARQTLDFTQPIALTLGAVLEYIADDEDPHRIVRELIDALPTGSYLVISHATADGLDPDAVAGLAARTTPDAVTETPRTEAQMQKFFTGTHLLKPGLVRAHEWTPDDTAGNPEPTAPIAVWAGVGEIGPQETRRAA